MIENKLKELRNKIKSLESAVIAFSGGVDSALLAKIAHDELGNKMVAVTGESESVPSRDLKSALQFCEKYKIPHLAIKTNEFNNELYVSNPENRCFYCKSELFDSIMKIADEKGFKFVVEGTNASELLGHRPGFQAAKENVRVATPYVDAKITKDEVREIARLLDLNIAERPSTACLSSRIPTGVRLDAEILGKIDEVENFLLELGVKQVRLRHNGEIARIETDFDGMNICVKKRDEITEKITHLGWRRVVLDLNGYKTGGGM